MSDQAEPSVFGFTSMLVKLLTEEQPDYLAVAFDTPARTFRDDLDADYKGTRKETPQLSSAQMPPVNPLVTIRRRVSAPQGRTALYRSGRPPLVR